MADQRLDAAKRLASRAQADARQHLSGAVERAGFERNHRSETRHLATGKLILWMRFETGIIHFLYPRMLEQELCYPPPIFIMLTHSHGQRLGSPHNEPRIHRGQDSPR